MTESGPAGPLDNSPRNEHLNQALRHAADHVESPLLLLDHELRVHYCNSAFLAAMDCPAPVLGTALTEAFPRLQHGSLERFLQKLERGTMQRLQGGLSNNFLATSAYSGDWGILVLFESEKQRRLIDQMSWELLDGIAHNFQTPLTSIRGYSETLLRSEGIDSATRDEFLKRINAQSSRLTAMVEDVLYLTRLRSMREGIDFALIDIRQPLLESISHNLLSAEDKGHGLSLSLPEKPLMAEADYRAFHELCCNLFENAIKYTPYGGQIEIRLEALEASEELQLCVADSGIGIAEELRERVFDKFFRAMRESEGPVPGTGLGLTKVRSIIEAHNGSVAATAGSDGGTVFTVRMPISQPHTQQ